MKTWYEKIRKAEQKANLIPKKPKNLGCNNCPGCGEILGFNLITGKNGNWINNIWYSGSFFHCIKHEQLNKGK